VTTIELSVGKAFRVTRQAFYVCIRLGCHIKAVDWQASE